MLFRSNDRPYGFVAMVHAHHAVLALEARHAQLTVRRNNRMPAAAGAGGSSGQTGQTHEGASSSSTTNHVTHHLYTTHEPTGTVADKLEDRTVWVGDLHKLSTDGGDPVLVPLIAKYLRTHGGPLDPAKPFKVRQSTTTRDGHHLGYAFVVFEHSRFAETALRHAVRPDAKLKVMPHKEKIGRAHV